jgi:hypothetical protein
MKEDSFMKHFINILQSEEVKTEMKKIFAPVTDLIMYEIYPYIYVIIFLVLLIFILILAILIMLVLILRNKSLISKIQT